MKKPHLKNGEASMLSMNKWGCLRIPIDGRSTTHGSFNNAACDQWRCLADVKCQLAFAQSDIGRCHAIEATQMFGPGFIDDLFEVAPGLRNIT